MEIEQEGEKPTEDILIESAHLQEITCTLLRIFELVSQQ